MKGKSLNRDSYNSIADWFVSTRLLSDPPLYVYELLKHIEYGDKILDLGCGGGVPSSLFLSNEGFDVTGVDFAENMIQKARIIVPNAKFEISDMLSYNGNEKYHAVLAWDSLYHLSYNNHLKIFKNIHQLLHNGGYFVFSHCGYKGRRMDTIFGKTFEYISIGSALIHKRLSNLGFKMVKYDLDVTHENLYLNAIYQK